MNNNIRIRAWQNFHKRMLPVLGVDFDENGEIIAVKTKYKGNIPEIITYSNKDENFWLEKDGMKALDIMTGFNMKSSEQGQDTNSQQNLFYGDIVAINMNKLTVVGIVSVSENGTKAVISDSYIKLYSESQGYFLKGEKSAYDIALDDFNFNVAELKIHGNIYEHKNLLEELINAKEV